MGAVTYRDIEFIELQVGGWMSARHPHLVETLGYCIDGNDFLLVTEYMSQGTLVERLVEYQESNPDKALLRKRKMVIAMDVARALEHLHKFDSIFLHFNLKSSNVLLDDNLNAKVSGFGPSKVFADGNLTQGGVARTKAAHVYSFGVVLMELLTGRPAVYNEQNLVTWFTELHALNFFTTKRQLFGDFSEESFCAMTELAMDCTADNSDTRPDINHVVSVLRYLYRKEGLVSLADLVE